MNPFSPARRKRAFLNQLPRSTKLLDVGCGSGSPEFTKLLRPDIYYVGLDITDYQQTAETKSYADEYVLAGALEFDAVIAAFGDEQFDAVLSAHNIEHCERPDRVLQAMCSVLKHGGYLYLSFPSEASTRMPSRSGTLNFYDDPTHKMVPKWSDILGSLDRNHMRITFAKRRYRPIFAALVGAFFEPFVAPQRKLAPKGATWALYGFESVIWATKS